MFAVICLFASLSVIKDSNAELNSYSDFIKQNAIYIDSEEGKSCYHALKKMARWHMEISNSEMPIAVNINKLYKDQGCEIKDYTIYRGSNVLFSNGFGGTREADYNCIKNNNTGKFIATLVEEFDKATNSLMRFGNGCEAIKDAIEMIDIMQ